MKAVVLAAGRGSRLGTLTADRPKCLVELGGATLLARQVRALRNAGASQVAVVTGWHAEAFDGVDVPRRHNPGWERGTMVDTLAVVDDWLRTDTLLVSYGDIVYTSTTARKLADSDAPIAVSYDPDWLALWERRFDDPLSDAETFSLHDNGDLAGIGQRATSLAQVRGQYMGLLRFTPAGWAAARAAMAEPVAHMTDLLDRIVTAGLCRVAAVAADGPWFEFDHPSDIDAGRDVLARLDEIEGVRP